MQGWTISRILGPSHLRGHDLRAHGTSLPTVSKLLAHNDRNKKGGDGVAEFVRVQKLVVSK